MNSAFVVSDSISPSAHKIESTYKSTGKTQDFYSILTEYSDSGDISIDESDLDAYETKGIEGRLILPSMKNVSILSKGLTELLHDLFQKNGLPEDPPVELKYSYSENKVTVYGGREDSEEIEDLINSDPDLKEYTRTFLAISSHAAAIQESIEFQEEYRRSSDPEAVVRKYSHLFNDSRKYPEVSFMFGSEPSLLADGKIYSINLNFDESGGTV